MIKMLFSVKGINWENRPYHQKACQPPGRGDRRPL